LAFYKRFGSENYRLALSVNKHLQPYSQRHGK